MPTSAAMWSSLSSSSCARQGSILWQFSHHLIIISPTARVALKPEVSCWAKSAALLGVTSPSYNSNAMRPRVRFREICIACSEMMYRKAKHTYRAQETLPLLSLASLLVVSSLVSIPCKKCDCHESGKGRSFARRCKDERDAGRYQRCVKLGTPSRGRAVAPLPGCALVVAGAQGKPHFGCYACRWH